MGKKPSPRKPKPKPNKKQVLIYMEPDMIDALEDIRWNCRIKSKTDLFAIMAEQFINKHQVPAS